MRGGKLAVHLVGAVLLWRNQNRFHALKKERRIVEAHRRARRCVATEYHKPTPECPHPGALAHV